MESFFSHRVLKSKRRAERGAAGFTLIEMLIVLAIIVIITAIALSGQSGFNRTLALNNTAYDIGLTIRQAQSYGLSSQGFGASGSHSPPYGVSLSSGNPYQYVFFEDIDPPVATKCGASAEPDCVPGDGEYTASDVAVSTYSLNNGFSFGDFCVTKGGSKVCEQNDGLSDLDITFVRPNTDTIIRAKGDGLWASYDDACLVLASDSGDERYILVLQGGEVEVGNETSVDPNGAYCP